MNDVVTKRPEDSILRLMAARYQMDEDAFAQVVIQMCIPKEATREHFAAFLLVAHEYELNPLTREIYAFVSKHGQLQVIVGVDGWMSLINRRPELDGMEFIDKVDDKGKLVAITCRMYRKDRAKPTEVTEYMSECVRATDQWKQWPARMLRHKTAIQCARYAFAISGLMEPDEADRMDVSGGPVIEHQTARAAPAAPTRSREAVITFNETPATPAREPARAVPADLGPDLPENLKRSPAASQAPAETTLSVNKPLREYTSGANTRLKPAPPAEHMTIDAGHGAKKIHHPNGKPVTAGEIEPGARMTINPETGEVLEVEPANAESVLLDSLDEAVDGGEASVRDWQNENLGLIQGLDPEGRKRIKAALAKAWEKVIAFPGDQK